VSFILVPKNGEEVQVNAWNWRPTLERLRGENLLTLENYERMGANGCGGEVNVELACRIADVIERKLVRMKPGERVLIDQTVTAETKKKLVITPETTFREVDAFNAYSASYDWLVRFRDFCRSSGGFEIL
jgi:hypothetical protein